MLKKFEGRGLWDGYSKREEDKNDLIVHSRGNRDAVTQEKSL